MTGLTPPPTVGELRQARLAVPRPDGREPGAGARYRRRLADLTDAALAGLWADAARRTGLDLSRGAALTAVGSLGRRDGGPLSDLDLLLVHDGRTLGAAEVAGLADALWYPLWDAHLDLDHAVRSLAECRSVASRDVPAAVGLLDVRAVAGDATLAAAASAAVLADWRHAARRRLPELLDSVTERAERAGELAYLIEPDLKEARGGLRDAVVVHALAASWLTDRPHGEFDTAWAHLLDVRDALTLVTGRRAARLLLPEQDDVAHRLGLGHPGATADAVVSDAADDLLTSLAQAARVVSAALDATVRRARRATRPSRFVRPLVAGGRALPPRLPSLGKGLAEHDGELVLAGDADPVTDPLLALRAAATAARTGLPLSPVTLESLAATAPVPAPWPGEARALLLDLLARGEAQVPVWEALDLAGVVTRWFPEWAAVRNRPQRNALHRHTVDRHLVQTAAQVPATAPASGTARDGDDREGLLLLAAFFHDIGKVPGGRDHSATGARLAGPLLDRLGLAPRDRDLVVLLVREHLLLPAVATTRDIADPHVLREVATAVGSREALGLLRRLTEADARAAGPQAWTAWRASLVDTLTARVAALLALP
ncbi:HD domain-containing protein [Georgenia yuyongxinii]|uniref:Bifunctional uridylyltransferase/uridylyl-removing enzyme n=1 Tax=Georgenia yuyongxinii TaxID=2589797 RepID=A0A552WRZ1_9MICO|nr:HD domain-containing protein [Georgenia yuyongxinii]TRW45173.1 HD domain-containing protein [Georgenia yuyongxinii]